MSLEISKEGNEFELNKLEFEKSLAQRNYEIDKFWQRGWFFGGLLLAIAGGYFGVTKENMDYSIFIAFLGFLVSLSQSLMNRGSKYWQERWELKTKNRESALGIDVTKTRKIKNEKYYLDSGTLAKDENFLVVARRFSVSKLTILVWDLITIFWFFLWIKTWDFDIQATPRIAAIIIHGLIILYVFFFFINNGKVYERFTKKKDTDVHKHNTREPYFTDSENYVENNLDYLNRP
jgi:hypothetical protein